MDQHLSSAAPGWPTRRKKLRKTRYLQASRTANLHTFQAPWKGLCLQSNHYLAFIWWGCKTCRNQTVLSHRCSCTGCCRSWCLCGWSCCDAGILFHASRSSKHKRWITRIEFCWSLYSVWLLFQSRLTSVRASSSGPSLVGIRVNHSTQSGNLLCLPSSFQFLSGFDLTRNFRIRRYASQSCTFYPLFSEERIRHQRLHLRSSLRQFCIYR